MSQISDFLENELLDAVFSQAAYTPTTLYLALHTADPLDDGSGAEVTGGSYARQLCTTSFAVAAGGSVSSNADISFTDMPAETVTHVAIWDAATAGNMLWRATLSASKTTNAGDTFTVSSGNLTFTLD